MEHGLGCITFDVQKHIAHLAACSGPRWFARGARICEGRLLINIKYQKDNHEYPST